jgi:hypothetical protein
MGTDNYLCWDLPTGGALVMFANQEVDVDASIGFATPQGDISYTAGDLIDMGYLTDGQLNRDADGTTSVLDHFTFTEADDLTDKSPEEVVAEEIDSILPGFTLLPLLAALGAAMLFSRKKHLGN